MVKVKHNRTIYCFLYIIKMSKSMSNEPYNGQITLQMLTPGDLVKYRHEDDFYVGEVVDETKVSIIHVLEQ